MINKNSVKLFIHELLRALDDRHKISPTINEYERETTDTHRFVMSLLPDDDRGRAIRENIPESDLTEIIKYIDNHIKSRGAKTSQDWYGIHQYFLPWITAITVDLLAEL